MATSKPTPRLDAGAARSRIRRIETRGRDSVRRWLSRRFRAIHHIITLPGLTFALFQNPRIHPTYQMTWRRKLGLALRMYRNSRRVFTGTSYKAHLAMTVKLLEIPPEIEGDVVECGCFYGGSTANLSLACEIAGRTLHVYDSFEGLPTAEAGDKYASKETEGFLNADIDRVKRTVAELGAFDHCEFHKGWFKDTLPNHDSPIVLCFMDVDNQSSLRDCVLNLWPHLTNRGYVFIDEYVFVDYCALFFSERFWRQYFDREPPGLLGTGTGIAVGEYFVGPWTERLPVQGPASVAYTRKDFSGSWEYFPDDEKTQGT